MSNPAVRLTLYIDESGSFQDAGFSEKETSSSRTPSQIVGLLGDSREIGRNAESVLAGAHADAGLALGKEVHATEIRDNEIYNDLIASLVRRIRQHHWQPVRLVNAEKVGYGSHAATYTNLVAELAVRLFETESRARNAPISLQLVCAVVKLGETEDGYPELLAGDEYRRRLDEHLAFAAVRRGLAQESLGWSISGMSFRSARTMRELQICDLLSNSSFRNFGRCREEVATEARSLFQPHDYTLVIPGVLDRADRLTGDGDLALAVRALAEHAVSAREDDPLRESIAVRATTIRQRLATCGAPARDAYLREIASWVEQIVNVQRRFTAGERLLEWLEHHLLAPLRASLGEGARTLDWFALTLVSWKLTLFNHLGRIAEARAASDSIDERLPLVAGHWEHGELIAGALVAQAVHRTDCFDHEEASRRAAAVVSYYAELSSLLCAALPEVFPERVRSELRGKALGTQLQAEMYASLRDPARIETARALSDAAIDEFTNEADWRRQYQYRCELETIAGKQTEARAWLAKSLGLESNEANHEAIAATIRSLEEGQQGFPLLHWLRLGAAICERPESQEATEFLSALRASRLNGSPWCTAAERPYPAHGIRRRLAFIQARSGNPKEALSLLGMLAALAPLDRGELVLALTETAAVVAVAGALWPSHPAHAHNLLDGTTGRKRPGALEMLERMRQRFAGSGFVLERAVHGWEDRIREALSGSQDPSAARANLTTLARTVPY